MIMDISDTLAPASDQLDAIELAGGPRVFTIKSVSRGSTEQPIDVALEEFDRPWRPAKGMRRVLAYCWGADASQWAGRRVELYFDESVTFGKDRPGGTRIRRLSHIDGPKSLPLLVGRGRSAMYHVDPLPGTAKPAEPAGPTASDIAACTDAGTLRGWWKASGPELRKAIESRVAALTKAEATVELLPDDDHEADMLALAAETETDDE